MGQAKLVITEADIVEASRLHHRSAIFSRRTALFVGAYTFGYALLIVLIWPVLFDSRTDDFWIAVWSFGCSAILFPILLYLAMLARYVFVTPKQARRHFAENKALHPPAECRWSDAELYFERPGNTSSTPWNHILFFQENESILLLYVTRGQYLPMPKRCFTRDDLAAIGRCLANAGVPRGKPPK